MNGGLGYSPAKPIAVGGGIVFGAFNQQQYLNALRRPGSAAIRYKRIGSGVPAVGDGRGPIDGYRIESDGMADVVLWLDMYTLAPLTAPNGFSLSEPAGGWRLPRGVATHEEIRAFEGPVQARTWKVTDASEGQTFGFIDADGRGELTFRITPNLKLAVLQAVQPLLASHPRSYHEAFYEDLFERCLPTVSGGVLKLQQWTTPELPHTEQRWTPSPNPRPIVALGTLILLIIGAYLWWP